MLKYRFFHPTVFSLLTSAFIAWSIIADGNAKAILWILGCISIILALLAAYLRYKERHKDLS